LRGRFVNQPVDRLLAPDRYGDASCGMVRVSVVVVAVFILAVVAAGLYLAYGNFPAPKTTVEKVLPDARFPK